MRESWLVGALLVAACHGQPAARPKGDPQFDAKWQAIVAAAQPAVIAGERGGGLMGEVRRAVDPPSTAAIAVVDTMPGPLPDPEVVTVIRRNLPGVKGCYEVEERAGTVGSGKAIVSLEIAPAGTVSNVAVDAPDFAASKLPACIQSRARGWTFPKFTEGPKKFSYPFVFVGG